MWFKQSIILWKKLIYNNLYNKINLLLIKKYNYIDIFTNDIIKIINIYFLKIKIIAELLEKFKKYKMKIENKYKIQRFKINKKEKYKNIFKNYFKKKNIKYKMIIFYIFE